MRVRDILHLSHYRAQTELFISGVPQLSLGQKARLTVTPDYVRNFTLRVQLAI